MKKYVLFILMVFAVKYSVTAQEKEMIIEGYLFKDSQNRISLGMPVVAMSTLGGHNYYFDKSIIDKFQPLINEVNRTNDNRFFYNYDWLNKEAKTDISRIPKIFLTLKAKVKVDKEDGPCGYNIYQVKDAKLMYVEWISNDWLIKWREAYRMLDLNYGDLQEGKKEKTFDRKEAGHLCDLLNQMYTSKPSKEQIEIVRKIDPDAKFIRRWQRSWEENHSKQISEILDKLDIKPKPKLPPFISSNVDFGAIIKKAKSRKEFLKNIVKDFGEDVLNKSAYVYIQKEIAEGIGSVRLEEISLLEIKDWTDKQFKEFQKNITKLPR